MQTPKRCFLVEETFRGSICLTSKAINRRNYLLKAYKSSGSPIKFLQYKLARNRIVSTVRKAKLLFFEQCHSVDAKTFRKLFKQLTRKESSIPALETPNTGTDTDNVQNADVLNNQYFRNFNHSVPSLTVGDICNLGSLDSSNFPEEFLCTENQVLELIHSLNSTKPTSAGDISVRMLNASALSISKTLSNLFNKSIIMVLIGNFSRIVPIPKSGCSKNPANLLGF